jgi:hypothetical protein
MSGTGIRYMAELEELSESYRTSATTLTLSTSVERATRRKLVARKPVIRRWASDRRQKGEKIALGVDEEKADNPELAPNPRCQNTHELWRCQHAHRARRVFPSPCAWI